MVLGRALFRLDINSKKCEFFFEYLKISCTFALSLTSKTNIMKLEELTQHLYNLIESNVSDGFARMEMYDLLDEIENLQK